jgi:hypothetical protein
MTEAEWLAQSSPRRLLAHLKNKVSDRKLRLFGVACCRRVAGAHTHPAAAPAVEIAERLADGEATDQERLRAYRAVNPMRNPAIRGFGFTPWHAPMCLVRRNAFVSATATSRQTVLDASLCGGCGVEGSTSYATEHVAQASLLRDIFGNPFRPVAFSPEWRTSTAVGIAGGMYESRDFGAMPILADALQDAGCDSGDVLGHCRGPGPHVRGCWVVDLVLGKE